MDPRRLATRTLLVLLAIGLLSVAAADAGAVPFQFVLVLDPTGTTDDASWLEAVVDEYDLRHPGAQYALVLPNVDAQTWSVYDQFASGGTFGTAAEMTSVLGGPGLWSNDPGIAVDGLLGVDVAYGLHDQSANLHAVLVTDAGRPVWDSSVSPESIESLSGAMEWRFMNAIVDHGFARDGSGEIALGMNQNIGWYADGSGGTAVVPFATSAGAGDPGVLASYVEPASSAWDINQATDADPLTRGSFAKGFADCKVSERGVAGQKGIVAPPAPPVIDPIVPEPGTALMLLAGGGLLVVLRRRSR